MAGLAADSPPGPLLPPPLLRPAAIQLTAGADSGLKFAPDGKTVLVPQPSNDPRDPLNWSSWKKHSILILLALCAAGGDFQSGAGIPLLSAQGETWGLSSTRVNEAGNLNVLFLGVGGLFWIPPLYFWGRLPVLFWSQLIGTFLVLGSCLVTSFEQYYVLRPLTSVFLTAGQTIGLTFVKDMFFFHEHARKIGIWACIFLASPYVGPFLGGFMVFGLNERWRPVLWLVFAYCASMLIAVIAFGHETWYDRSLAVQPERTTTGILGRVYDLTGVTAFRQRKYKMSVWNAVARLLEVFTKPVSWMVFFIYALAFMWSVGINITSSIVFAIPKAAGGYGFSTRTISFIYFTPIVALVIGELLGHHLNDWVANRYIRKHNGLFKPEARLPPFFLAVFLMIPGLVLCGQALEKQLTVGAVVIGWGMYVVGVMLSSVAIQAYILDCFPSAAGEVCSLINFSRTIAGFSVGYFQFQWGENAGFDVSFGIQSAIVGAAALLTVVLVMFGERMRQFGGPLRFSGHH